MVPNPLYHLEEKRLSKYEVLRQAVLVLMGAHHCRFVRDGSGRERRVCQGEHHADDQTLCLLRIQAAIDMVIRHAGRAPLIIAGDANNGRDILRWRQFALDQGVRREQISLVTSDEQSTLTDLRKTALLLFDQPVQPHQVWLVTDDWHMLRAGRMARCEFDRFPTLKCVQIIEHSVRGFSPPEHVRVREMHGIKAYLDGTYQVSFNPSSSDASERAWGKPAFEAQVK